MPIHTFPIGPLGSNSYIYENNVDAVLIDPPDDYEPILDFIRKNNLTLKALLCTHLHFDHVSGVAYFHKTYHLPIYAGEGDINMKDTFFGRAMTFGMPAVEPFEPLAFKEGKAEFGSISCELISTPGHSPGGFCFYFEDEKILASGDTLFRRSIGRSDLPGGNAALLLNSIRTKLYVLPEDTKVYPGHERATTIGEEKNMNPYCPLNAKI